MTIKETITTGVEKTREALDTTEGRIATGVIAGLLAIWGIYKYINRNK